MKISGALTRPDRTTVLKLLLVGVALVLVVVGSAVALLAKGNKDSGAAADPNPGGAGSARPIDEPHWSVTKENQLPGTTAWKLTHPGPTDAIEGYADHTDVLPGDPFTLYVSTTAPGFHVEAYRMGWYGGKQGRLVWTSDHEVGKKQPAPKMVPGVNEVYTQWTPSMTVTTTGWPEGDYLLKLVSDAGNDRYVTITLRSASARGRTVFMNSVTTWAAYNQWGGGRNVYGDGTKSKQSYVNRSRKVSFDRPYDKNGSYFNWYELPMLSIAERSGVSLAYETDVDLDSDPTALSGARALIFAGHDEYWSQNMRDNTLQLRDSGTNVAFFSSNNAYRHVRLESSSLGPNRVVVVYKDAAEDPMSLTDPEESTQQWRLPPDPRPESVLTGVYYECNPVYAPFVVTDPNAWIFAGTGVKAGQKFPGLEGVESDRLTAGVPVPRPIHVVSNSPVNCGGKLRTVANGAFYTVPSGAEVFASGTMNWSCSVFGVTGCRNSGERPVPTASGDFAARVTVNILRAFSQGPAGTTHPAVDNYAQWVTPPSRLTYNY